MVFSIAHNSIFWQSSTSNSLPQCYFPINCGNSGDFKLVNKLYSSLSSCQPGLLEAVSLPGHSSSSQFWEARHCWPRPQHCWPRPQHATLRYLWCWWLNNDVRSARVSFTFFPPEMELNNSQYFLFKYITMPWSNSNFTSFRSNFWSQVQSNLGEHTSKILCLWEALPTF